MSLADLFSSIRALSRTEKLQLIQVLAADLAEAEETVSLVAGRACPVWSPHDAHEAAAVLLKVLDAERARP
jgi:hypothetical protein